MLIYSQRIVSFCHNTPVWWTDRQTSTARVWCVKKLIRSQCWTDEEENGSGLDTHWEMMTALSNRHDSGHRTTAEEESKQWIPGKDLEKVPMRGLRHGWRKMEVTALDRDGWRQMVCGLWCTGCNKALVSVCVCHVFLLYFKCCQSRCRWTLLKNVHVLLTSRRSRRKRLW